MISAEGSSSISLFVPETYDMFWSLVVLVVLAVFFFVFFMPRFQKIFDERARRIEGNMEKAEKASQEAEAAKQKYEDQLKNARVEASKIRDNARAEATNIIADARSRAESEAKQISDKAQKSIESQQRQALVTLKGEVGSLATALAGKILDTQLQSSAVQDSMIDSMISNMEGTGSAEGLKSQESR